MDLHIGHFFFLMQLTPHGFSVPSSRRGKCLWTLNYKHLQINEYLKIHKSTISIAFNFSGSTKNASDEWALCTSRCRIGKYVYVHVHATVCSTLGTAYKDRRINHSFSSKEKNLVSPHSTRHNTDPPFFRLYH